MIMKKASERIEAIGEILEKKNYDIITDYGSGNYCFDIIASKKDDKKRLIIHTAEDIQQCSRNIAQDMKKLAMTVDGVPLLVGSKMGKRELETGVLYKKHGILAIDLDTLEIFLAEKQHPLIYADKGGLYVKINPKKLKLARLEKGFSLGELAQKIGVSRKAVYEYERGNMDVTLDVAIKLEEVLDADLIEPIGKLEDIIKWNIEKEKTELNDQTIASLYRILSKAGFNVLLFRKTPFDIAARKEEIGKRIIVKNARKRIEEKEISLLSDIAELIKALVLLVVKHGHNKFLFEKSEKLQVINERFIRKIEEILIV